MALLPAAGRSSSRTPCFVVIVGGDDDDAAAAAAAACSADEGCVLTRLNVAPPVVTPSPQPLPARLFGGNLLSFLCTDDDKELTIVITFSRRAVVRLRIGIIHQLEL